MPGRLRITQLRSPIGCPPKQRATLRALGLRKIRQSVERDLRRRGLPREKVVAAIVNLLDTTRVRIGNLSYARNNHSF